ncbi:MAG: transposase [Serpentinimonas sp.]|nr:MAG: transposase [Comamonadaceae bacterium BICA1-1]MDO9611416.1 transposase [Serpentinimonas sp.]
MAYHPDLRHRRSLRLQGYDYAQAGAYFVTICTQDRACVFGAITDGAMRHNDAGRLIKSEWDALPGRFPGIEADGFIVMPNHVHGILWIPPTDTPSNATVGAQFIAPSTQCATNQGAMNRAPTLGDIVRAFKAVVTRRLRQMGLAEFSWQRNYYEHIIRNDEALNHIREYIVNNPLQWALDRENPENAGGAMNRAPTEWEGI